MKYFSVVTAILLFPLFSVSTATGAETIAETLQAAVEKTNELKDHNATLQKLVESYEHRNKELSEQNSNLEKKVAELTAVSNDWKSKYESVDVVDQVLVESGEYNQGLKMVGIRIDPRDANIQGTAGSFCTNKGSPRIKQLHVHSGGCCGYSWWAVACLRGK